MKINIDNPAADDLTKLTNQSEFFRINFKKTRDKNIRVFEIKNQE